MATEAGTKRGTTSDGPDAVARAAVTLDAATMRAREVLDRASDRMPLLVDRAAAALNDSARRLDESPDDVLATGAAFSTGLAAGLYIGGAPRILVTAAMLLALAMGWTLLGRSGRRTGTRTPG